MKIEMEKFISVGIIAVVLLISALLIRSGCVKNAISHQPLVYTVYGYEGVLYRLNQVNGRLDVLVPSNDAALLFPVGQMQIPTGDNLTEEQKNSLAQNVRTVSQYIQMANAKLSGNLDDKTKTKASFAPKKTT